jgi:Concanavalin A-like lectin/glucanases superfamily
VARNGLAMELDAADLKAGSPFDMPRLPQLDSGGFAIDLWVRFRELTAGQTILDSRDASGKGIALTMTDRSTWALSLNDGRVKSAWDCDPGTHPGTLKVGEWQHVAAIADGGPKIVTWIVDGVLNDGGAVREYGWSRFHPAMSDVNGAPQAKAAVPLFGEMRKVRVYNRYLRTSEAVGNYRAG